MTNFKKLKTTCQQYQAISIKIIDKGLIPLATKKKDFERKISTAFSKYNHLLMELDSKIFAAFLGQYLGHLIFKENGWLPKFLKLPEVKQKSEEELEYLELLQENPWRFSYSVLLDNPHKDFYLMGDVFTGEEFLLYSPSVSKYLSEKSPITLWSNLIGYNGECYQSYGPVGAFTGFDEDDIHYFAHKVNSKVYDVEEILEEIEHNPLPFILLPLASQIPQVISANHRLTYNYSEYDVENFDAELFEEDFEVESEGYIHKFHFNGWEMHPHFTCFYYNEKEKSIFLFSMTDAGHEALVDKLSTFGLKLHDLPDFRASFSMVQVANDILDKDIEPDPYSHLFSEIDSPEEQESLAELNKFLGLLMQDINEGREPDLETLAEMVGIDIETAEDILDTIYKQMGKK